MAVLSDVDLKRILDDNDGIVILRRREKSITGVGYDLTIGFIRDAATGKIPETFTDEDNVSRYTLLAGHRYLVISKEFIYLSPQYMATLHSRGSYALKGIIVTSTTIDPNYAGCIAGSLFNCSPEDIHIKKDNQFATMVFHQLSTPTNLFLPLNERGNPMDTLETFHGRFSNIHSDACDAADTYHGQVRKAVEHEHSAAQKRIYQKAKESIRAIEESQSPAKENSLKGAPAQKDSRETAKENRKLVKITFLIGNGFDLNVGLKTSYSDFYAYYTKEYPDDFLAKKIEQDKDDWADLEWALGQSTKQTTPQRKNEFFDSEENLENALVEYLESEMKKLCLESSKTRLKAEGAVYSALTKFYKKSEVEDIEELKNIMENANNLTEYSFINFNFTNTLEQCLNTLGNRFPSLHFSSFKNETVLHIHGSICDKSVVVGVNDESQIANEDFRDNESKTLLIKSYINDSYKNTRVNDARTIIDSSDIICIFGMSLGITDRMWWQHIAKWLQQDCSHKLVIFTKKEKSKVSKGIGREEKRIRKKFFENGEIPLEIRPKLEEQIYVIVNAVIFPADLV